MAVPGGLWKNSVAASKQDWIGKQAQWLPDTSKVLSLGKLASAPEFNRGKPLWRRTLQKGVRVIWIQSEEEHKAQV